jgi:catechol 2,3-dioxygenase-like lactoylglutathione lyase family enzyme
MSGRELRPAGLTGAGHISLTVTDLDRSEQFYTEVLGLLRLADFGHARVLVHRESSFMLTVIRHDNSAMARFSELTTGLDHLGFAVSSRDALVEWERWLAARGVTYTPIRDMELGSHLNFRDPDGIALELSVLYDVAAGWLAELREREIPRQEIDARLQAYLSRSVPGT